MRFHPRRDDDDWHAEASDVKHPMLVTGTQVDRLAVVPRRGYKGWFHVIEQATAFIVGQDERGVRPCRAAEQGRDSLSRAACTGLNVIVRVLVVPRRTRSLDEYNLRYVSVRGATSQDVVVLL